MVYGWFETHLSLPHYLLINTKLKKKNVTSFYERTISQCQYRTIINHVTL